MADTNQIDLLLIGKTGNGKSATGNSILRRRAFTSKASSESVTSEIQYEVSEFNGRIIKVVDGPGVGDNRINNEEAVKLMMKSLEYAISANPRGYHAFLLVVRFGGRFTAEDQDTIDFLKKIFGQDFVKKFCILILTCGDNFENESEETGKSFEDWCKEEQGKFQDLLKECDNRVVLFDNATKDTEKKKKQVAHLLKVVDNLSSGGKRYTDENFQRAKEQRDRIMVELKKSVIQEEIMTETSLILMKMQEILAKKDFPSKIEPLENLQIRAEYLFESLSAKDRGTGVLHEMTSTVKSIKKNICDEIKLCYRLIQEKEEARQREEEIKRKHEEEKKILKEKSDMKAKENARILEENRKLEKEQEMWAQERRDFNQMQRMLREQERKNIELDAAKQLERELLNKQLQKEKLYQDQLASFRKEAQQREENLKQEQSKIKKENEDLENERKKLQQENDRGIISRIYDTVKWPFRKLVGLFSSK